MGFWRAIYRFIKQYQGSSSFAYQRPIPIPWHANHALQSDFSRFGANYFEVTVLERGASPSSLPRVEADCILSLLNSGSALYNLTADGQGTGRKSRIPNLSPTNLRGNEPKQNGGGSMRYLLRKDEIFLTFSSQSSQHCFHN